MVLERYHSSSLLMQRVGFFRCGCAEMFNAACNSIGMATVQWRQALPQWLKSKYQGEIYMSPACHHSDRLCLDPCSVASLS